MKLADKLNINNDINGLFNLQNTKTISLGWMGFRPVLVTIRGPSPLAARQHIVRSNDTLCMARNQSWVTMATPLQFKSYRQNQHIILLYIMFWTKCKRFTANMYSIYSFNTHTSVFIVWNNCWERNMLYIFFYQQYKHS